MPFSGGVDQGWKIVENYCNISPCFSVANLMIKSHAFLRWTGPRMENCIKKKIYIYKIISVHVLQCCQFNDQIPCLSQVEWTKDGKPFKGTDQIRLDVDQGVRKLIFDNATFEDAGQYVCKFNKLESTAKVSVIGEQNNKSFHSSYQLSRCI